MRVFSRPAGLVLLLLASVGPLAADALREAAQRYRSAEYEAAIQLLRNAGGGPAADALLGKAYYGAGDFGSAVDALRRATRAEPDNAGYWHWLGKSFGRLAETGSVFKALGRARKCRGAFEEAVELAPENVAALTDLFSFYLDAPGIVGGGVDKAEAIAARIGELDPAGHRKVQAELAKKRKDWAAAETHYRQAMELEPDRLDRITDLAVFLAGQGNIEESDLLFEEASRKFPRSPKLWYHQARALIKADRKPDAARELLNRYLNAQLTADDPARWEARRLLEEL